VVCTLPHEPFIAHLFLDDISVPCVPLISDLRCMITNFNDHGKGTPSGLDQLSRLDREAQVAPVDSFRKPGQPARRTNT
jgi:hypothetical protein